MQHQGRNVLTRLIFVGVCLAFIHGGAFLIYKEYRQGIEDEQLDRLGIEAVATVTSQELESLSSGASEGSLVYVTQFTFTPASGDRQAGETLSFKDTEEWFHVPPKNERILPADLAVGDKILVTYLPEDPRIHRTKTGCPDCLDLGAFGDNISFYFGGLLILLGASILFRIRRLLLAPL